MQTTNAGREPTRLALERDTTGSTVSYEEIERSARDYIRQRVAKLVGKCGFTMSDCEDIEQEIMISLCEQLRLYDPGRGSVEQFINKVATSRIRNIVRQQIACKRDFRMIAFSLDSILRDEDGPVGCSTDALNAPGFGYYTQDQLDLKIALEQAMDELPLYLVRLCEALKRGSISAAARELGISRRTARRRMEELRDFLDTFLSDVDT
ncbi:MAG: sigma-70 family RNA polymerase sigma factor [Chloroflexi bacterium]|nr:sigma-70 family RNA polymerase sigma factor [Chloroflexota bacterium]